MSRISRDQMWMMMAKAAAMRSTCYRLNVGCVIVNSKHSVVSIGYNGAPSTQSHCTGNGCQYFTDAGCKVIHAEANALVRARQSNPYDLIRARLYCTHSPCNDCVDLITKGCFQASNMAAIVYETEYRDRSPVDRLIRETEIGIYRLSPSGFLVDMRTGNLAENIHA